MLNIATSPRERVEGETADVSADLIIYNIIIREMENMGEYSVERKTKSFV